VGRGARGARGARGWRGRGAVDSSWLMVPLVTGESLCLVGVVSFSLSSTPGRELVVSMLGETSWSGIESLDISIIGKEVLHANLVFSS